VALRENRNVNARRLLLFFLAAALCLAQGDWRAQTSFPGVDFSGLSAAKKQAALTAMRSEGCGCGCNMKIAECRMKDPSCGVSRKLAKAAVAEAAQGKTAAVIQADLKRIATEPPALLDDPVKISITGDPALGPQNARVTMVEYSDFQCPYCSQVVPKVKEVLKAYPNDIRFVFKQFPLEDHSEAEFGAEAALAAQAQGKFWEMHDLLYAGFPHLERDRVFGYARKIGLDMKRFTAEVDSHKYLARIRAEKAQGEDDGVEGTPTFFIDGKRYNGAFNVAALTPVLHQELKH
jgi:protein-disulfide isomerase